MVNSVSKPPSPQARRIWSDNPDFVPVSETGKLCIAIKKGKRKPPRPLRRQHPPAHLDLIEYRRYAWPGPDKGSESSV
jgi:hypothetical protein